MRKGAAWHTVSLDLTLLVKGVLLGCGETVLLLVLYEEAELDDL